MRDDVEFDDGAVKKHLAKPELRAPLEALTEAFRSQEPFAAAPLEQTLRAIAETHNLKAAALIHATRVAVTGRAASPGLFEVLELAGRERVTQRLERAAILIPA